MARLWAPLVLSLALVVAGCSGFAGGPAEDRTTVAPGAVPTTTDRADGRYVAPGVTAEGLVDPGALQRAHTTQLANASHTFRERVTRRDANGTILSQYTTVVRRNGSAVRYRYVRRATAAATSLRIDSWADGQRVYTARTEGNATTYSVEDTVATARRVPLGPSDYGASLGRVFGLLSVDVAGTDRENGSVRYRLTTTRVRDVPPLENVRFEGTVTPEGVLAEYRISYRVRRNGEPVDVTVRVTVDDIGTTAVERPSWYQRAVSETE